MKKFLFMAVAAIAALSSCSSDNDLLTGETGKKALTFTATMEGSATRATYDSGNKCASWEEGDQISVNGKTYRAQSAGLTTTFKVATKGQEATGDNYTAYFPATLYNNGTPTLPSTVTETWADGKFNMPMYATSEDTNLEFKNLCGVLKITVKSSQIDKVKKIKVSSENLAVSGAFTVDDNNAAVLTNASNKATLTVTYTDAVATTAGGVVFYVAVPAQTYQQLKIELSADGTNFTKSMTTKSATVTVARSKIYPITFADNAPETTGSASRTGGTYVNWVQLWENGPKFAEFNVGASNATQIGTVMTFADATKTGDDYVWGAAWCTPSKDDMDELRKAATSAGSEMVVCEYAYKNGAYGFQFTGKKDGYTENSVFFPAQSSGLADYWSGTSNGSNAWCMSLRFTSGLPKNSTWNSYSQSEGCLVRPVLSSSSSNTGNTGNTPTPYSVKFESFDSNWSATATASNDDVTVTLTLSSTEPSLWYEGRYIDCWDEGKMTIKVTPKRSGVAVTGIVYKGDGGETTKKGTGPWYLTIEDGNAFDSGDDLGHELVSVTVNYTKQ